MSDNKLFDQDDMESIYDEVVQAIGKETGFILMVFPFGQHDSKSPGTVQTTSNCTREQMQQVMGPVMLQNQTALQEQVVKEKLPAVREGEKVDAG